MKIVGGSLLCVTVGLVSAFYAQPYVVHNSDVILIVVTVFTVFAGFLVAIIALVGDPSLIPEGSWRMAELGREKVKRTLMFNVALFVSYLITIALLFVGVIIERCLSDESILRIWIERGYLFFGVTSFLFTFALPIVLMKLQQARYDSETEKRRRGVGIQR